MASCSLAVVCGRPSDDLTSNAGEETDLTIRMSPEILHVHAIAYDQWLSLWSGYLGDKFGTIDPAVHQGTFARLRDPQSRLRGFVAVSEVPIGFAHFYFHPSTYSLAPACTLDDLYVTPESRGQGTARKLIDAVAAQARSSGAHVLHWKTRESNASAIALYDKVAARSGYVSYHLDL
jgi:GNAT superfamily N-acetyltransferase